jgi:NDP-sugar pyrophosphorylase family protein
MGKRLMPYSSRMPKPLFPIFELPAVEYVLSSLKKARVTEVAVNLFHLGEMIKETLGNGSRFDLKIHYFHEKTLFGTGGGLRNAGKFFNGEDFFIVHNGDIYSEIDLNELVDFHRSTRSSATMVVTKDQKCSNIFAVHVDQDQQIAGIYHPDLVSNAAFCGIQVLSQNIFSYLPETFPSCLIRDGYQKMINREKISAFELKNYWSDIGTLEQYLRTHLDLFPDIENFCKRHGLRIPHGKAEGIYIAEGASVHSSSQLIPRVFVGKNAVVEEDVSMGPDVIVLPEARIIKGSCFKNTVVF